VPTRAPTKVPTPAPSPGCVDDVSFYVPEKNECAPCADNCGTGQYRFGCGHSAAGQCVACSTPKAHAHHAGSGSHGQADSCREECDAGYHAHGGACIAAYMGTCANGSLLGGDNVAVHAARTQDNHCGACDAGYTLVNKACQPFAGACTNGALTTQASRDQHNHCGSCSNGYFLNNKSCTAWTNCGNNQYQSTSPHGTRNRGCSTCRSACSGATYQTSSCANGNGSNRACAAWTNCGNNQYQSTSPATTDCEN